MSYETRLYKLPEWARWIAQHGDGAVTVYEFRCCRLTHAEIEAGKVLVRVG